MRWLMLAVFLVAGCGDGAECAWDGDCDMSAGEYCDASDKTCKCYWWEGRSVTFYVNEDCCSDPALESCLAAVQSAIDYWNSPECSDMLLVYGGTTPRRDVGYDPSRADNINLIIWLESGWQTQDCPEPGDPCREPTALALTTTFYDTYSGEVLDTDIELNGEGVEFSASDIEGFLVDEFGRMLGVEDLDSLCEKFPAGQASPCADEVVGDD